MIRIALCDDEIEYLTLMENFIREKLSLAAVEHVIEKFTNGEELLNSPHIDSYYAVFLDIVMPAVSGLQVESIGHYIMVVTTEEKIKVRAKISEYFDDVICCEL